MKVYLWVAGSAEGVTDDDGRARSLAAGSMLENGAPDAVVEPAVFDDATKSLEAGYVRTAGLRWTAHRQGGHVVWNSRRAGAPEPRPLRAAS